MKIRSRLTLQFSIIVASILILFSIAIYILSAYYRKQEFYLRLRDRAHNTAKLLLEVQEVDTNLMRIIDKNTVALTQEKILIFNSENYQIYNSADDSATISQALLKKIRAEKEIEFKDEKDIEFLCFVYLKDTEEHVVMASAYDKFGFRKLDFLRIVLILGLFASVGITMLAGWFYSGQALKPISNVIKQVDNISAGNLNLRVDEGNGTDEIALLAITFNKMLSRLEQAFEMQRSFVSNASHELRTPLTTITGQLDVALMKTRSSEEYKAMLESILEDIKNLSQLSNGLLDLAHASFDVSKINFETIRIDELLWQSREELMRRNPDYSINIQFENFPDDENKLIVSGNEHLLKTSIVNLMDNACKFSQEKSVEILFSIAAGSAHIYFKDKGIGISPNEIEQVFEPFYRGENARAVKGHGLGLSLTNKIIQLHNGKIYISSQLNHGTTVTVTLPLMS